MTTLWRRRIAVLAFGATCALTSFYAIAAALGYDSFWVKFYVVATVVVAAVHYGEATRE